MRRTSEPDGARGEDPPGGGGPVRSDTGQGPGRVRPHRPGGLGKRVTPGGGRPAVEASRVHQACRWAPGHRRPGSRRRGSRRRPAAGGPASSPNRVDIVWVTVPPSARYAAPVGVERVGEPGPADPGQQRVGGQVDLQFGGHVGDQAQGALPRLVSGRVVQQDQPAGGHLVAVAQHGGAERERVGASRCGAPTSSRTISGRGSAAAAPPPRGRSRRERDRGGHAGSLWRRPGSRGARRTSARAGRRRPPGAGPYGPRRVRHAPGRRRSRGCMARWPR